MNRQEPRREAQDFAHRAVRSFVRREGRITAAQRRALDELLPNFGIEVAFDQDAPLCLEVGFGNGDALLGMATNYPDWNFVGIDVYRPGVGKLLLQLEDREIRNVRVSTLDAIEFLSEHLPQKSLNALYVLFPDPWPKKRHHKRRLINVRFLDLVDRCLKTHGRLHIATDIDSYAEQVSELLDADNRFVACAADGEFPVRPTTKYENRGVRLGHKIHDFILNRHSDIKGNIKGDIKGDG